ncbi:FtsX-like permease family protein [candidate division KSB1 bacterium]|nr:FtsX-like permease family protein [candidate division KSB1 bacterium]
MSLKIKIFYEINENIHIAFTSLVANKMRALLTMLGIIIGVAAVITMVGLGAGAQKAVESRLEALGSNLLYIRPGSSRHGRIHFGAGSRQTLKNEDVKALNRYCSSATYIIPEYDSRAQVEYGSENWNCEIVGTVPQYEQARNFAVQEGRYFNDEEVTNNDRVAVIGTEIRQNLFSEASPVGKVIKIKQQNFVVIGLLEQKGQVSWRNMDDQILVPISTAQNRLFGVDYLSGITIQVTSDELIDEAFIQVEKILRRQHRLRREQDNDFNIRNQSDLISTYQETNKTFGFLLASIAGVSLLVGGIGIMNIMLVSVTERTREIGVRKAIGARRKDIMLQFLIESLTISLIGGIVGILLGMVLSYLLATLAQWNTMISFYSILLSFGFASAVGLFFGIWPARKASLLNPIIALRYE